MKERKMGVDRQRKAREQSTDLLDQLGLVPREAVAAAFGRSVRMLKRDHTLRRGPKPVTFGKKVFYLRTELEQYFRDLAKRNASR